MIAHEDSNYCAVVHLKTCFSQNLLLNFFEKEESHEGSVSH